MRSLGYNLFIIGCQQNVYDGERIAFLLDRLGHFPTTEKDADLIIILSCSVRQKAVDRLWGKIGRWQKMIKHKKIIITACLLPKEKKLFKSVVDDIVLPTEIIDYLIKNYSSATSYKLPPSADPPLAEKANSLSDGFLPKDRHHAYVPITIGCNNFCTFCAVPYTRGQEISRDESEIINEIRRLIESGIKEITLLGQNVNSYGLSDWKRRDLRKNRDRFNRSWSANNPSPFVTLLKKIEKIEKISFLSPNPQDMSDDLINWMATSQIFSQELNLPLQSGDDEVLRRMNRRYNQKEYLNLVQKIRQAVPDIWLSTDIIVGFPGETKQQFQNTVNLVKQIGFNKAFVSQYSPRPGTVSAKIYSDDVPAKEKKRRWQILDQLINSKERGSSERLPKQSEGRLCRRER